MWKPFHLRIWAAKPLTLGLNPPHPPTFDRIRPQSPRDQAGKRATYPRPFLHSLPGGCGVGISGKKHNNMAKEELLQFEGVVTEILLAARHRV
jgi:hypothetical protein